MTSSEYLGVALSVFALGSVLSLTAYNFSRESKYIKDKVRRKELNRIIKLFKKSDSACAEWAIGVVKGENK